MPRGDRKPPPLKRRAAADCESCNEFDTPCLPRPTNRWRRNASATSRNFAGNSDIRLSTARVNSINPRPNTACSAERRGPEKRRPCCTRPSTRRICIRAWTRCCLRRTFPELEASLITYFRRDVPRELYEKYNEAKHTVTWLNGSTTRFAYCDYRKRRLPLPGRRISIHRRRRADALHPEAVAISHQPQSLPHQRRQALHGRRHQSRQHRPRLGEGAVGRSRHGSGDGPPRPVRSGRLRIYSRNDRGQSVLRARRPI